MDTAVTKEEREYIWNYFHMHASQRLTTFNFYIVMSTLLATGLFATLEGNTRVQPIDVVLGLLLILLSFVFYKLDRRNKVFISNAENALKYMEKCDQELLDHYLLAEGSWLTHLGVLCVGRRVDRASLGTAPWFSSSSTMIAGRR